MRPKTADTSFAGMPALGLMNRKWSLVRIVPDARLHDANADLRPIALLSSSFELVPFSALPFNVIMSSTPLEISIIVSGVAEKR